MPSYRLFASCLVAVVLCAVTDLSFAEQVSGQLQISLTILKRCEIITRSDDTAVRLSDSGCEHAAYQVRDVQGRALHSSGDTGMTPMALQQSVPGGSTLEIYW